MLCAQAPVGIQRPTIYRERGQESPEGEVSATVDQSSHGGEDAFFPKCLCIERLLKSSLSLCIGSRKPKPHNPATPQPHNPTTQNRNLFVLRKIFGIVSLEQESQAVFLLSLARDWRYPLLARSARRMFERVTKS